MTPTEPLADFLNSLDAPARADRDRAVANFAAALAAGRAARPSATGRVNLHCHTFHSYNVFGCTPSRIVGEAVARGFDAVGMVDFDVVDALDETFAAGDALGMPAIVALETRAYAADYASREINSPGEPGVAYTMAVGFARTPAAGTEAAATLASLRDGAQARNRAMLSRILPALAPLALDYDRDVLPLTPSGNATERHILAAIDAAAESVWPDAGDRAQYWARLLGVSNDEAKALAADAAKRRNAVRAKLMKKGGPGYVQPDESTFPPVAKVYAMAEAAGAIPCHAWLDGTSAGEADADALVGDFVRYGARAAALVPDRNWNIKDPAARAKKVANLNAWMAAATKRGLWIHAGTELNNYGQPWVDDFDAPELAPHAEAFRAGARALWGHTLLERARGWGLMGAWGEKHFGRDPGRAAGFYGDAAQAARVLGAPEAIRRAARLPDTAGPKDVLSALAT